MLGLKGLESITREPSYSDRVGLWLYPVMPGPKQHSFPRTWRLPDAVRPWATRRVCTERPYVKNLFIYGHGGNVRYGLPRV
jgi:hypothetical protein